jgi:hypothetical protein
MGSALSTSAAPPRSHASITVRRATAVDGPEQCALLARVAMDSDLALSIRRDPDFDALYRLQARDWESWVAEMDGTVEGTGTVLVRNGYLDGVRIPVGYLGDLRLSHAAEGRHLLDRMYGPILRSASERFGCNYYLTAIIASNDKAKRALTVPTARSQRGARPTYTLLREFDIRSIHLVLPRMRERLTHVVRRATDADIPSLARFLDDDSRTRPFGYVLDEAELRRRLTCWPGLSARSFHLAEDAGGRIVGCLALWDAAPAKRTIVMAYRGRMRRVRMAYDFAARIFGRDPLPRPGQEFRYQYATHVAVPSNDPSVMRALLQSAYHAARAEGYHFISVCAPVGDALDPAYRGYLTTDLRAELHVVTLPGVEVPALEAGVRPGFEMALV